MTAVVLGCLAILALSGNPTEQVTEQPPIQAAPTPHQAAPSLAEADLPAEALAASVATVLAANGADADLAPASDALVLYTGLADLTHGNEAALPLLTRALLTPSLLGALLPAMPAYPLMVERTGVDPSALVQGAPAAVLDSIALQEQAADLEKIDETKLRAELVKYLTDKTGLEKNMSLKQLAEVAKITEADLKDDKWMSWKFNKETKKYDWTVKIAMKNKDASKEDKEKAENLMKKDLLTNFWAETQVGKLIEQPITVIVKADGDGDGPPPEGGTPVIIYYECPQQIYYCEPMPCQPRCGCRLFRRCR